MQWNDMFYHALSCSDDQLYMVAYTCVVCTDLPPLKDYERSQVSGFTRFSVFASVIYVDCMQHTLCRRSASFSLTHTAHS